MHIIVNHDVIHNCCINIFKNISEFYKNNKMNFLILIRFIIFIKNLNDSMYLFKKKFLKTFQMNMR